MSKQENFLSLILNSLGKEVPQKEFIQLLSFITANCSFCNFYQFIPTKYGVTSYELQHTLSKLNEDCTIKIDGNISIKNKEKISQYAQKNNIDEQIQVLKIIKIFYENKEKCISHIKKIYTFNSIYENKGIIFTAGYEGATIDSFIKRIIKFDIKNLIDVRYNPISRKFGFSKKQLNAICKNFNVKYIHVPSLGIPGEARKCLNNRSDYETLFKDYEKNVLDKNFDEQEYLIKIIKDIPSVLVCFEADKNMCHRTRLAKRLSKNSGMKILDI